jgi:hypothetical protein
VKDLHKAEELAKGASVFSPRDAAGAAKYHLLLAKDLKLIRPKDHAELSQRAAELKRMLTALLQRLKPDR